MIQMKDKKALMVLADGFEEVEASAPVDVLRRANVNVTIAGLSKKEVPGARGIKVLADTTLDEAKGDFDAVIFPGGQAGAENLSKSERVRNLIKEMNKKGKIIAAICASPAVVLAPTGVLKDKKAACYPGMEKEFSKDTCSSTEAVVIDGNIVTSKGPGTALDFGLKLAELLAGKEIASSVKEKMLVK